MSRNLSTVPKADAPSASSPLAIPAPVVLAGSFANRSTVAIPSLPRELAAKRILNSREASAFAGFSVPHWRRLYRNGIAPAPLRIGARKLGWRADDLMAWIDSRPAR